MVKHRTQIYLMAGLFVVAVLLFSTGNGAGWLPLVFVGTCVVMVLLTMMGGMGGGQHGGGRGENTLSPTPGQDRDR